MYLDQGVKVLWQVVSGNFLVTRIRKREEQIYSPQIEGCLPAPDTVWKGILSLITVGESVISLDGTYKRSRSRSRYFKKSNHAEGMTRRRKQSPTVEEPASD